MKYKIKRYDIIKEEYKDIVGYEERYLISNKGNVWSNLTSKELSKNINGDGYEIVSLTDSMGDRKPLSVHRIVAKAFIPNTEGKPVINHKNGIKTDNRVNNLEWCTVQENTQHSYDNGFQIPLYGEEHGRSIYTEEQVELVCELLEIGKKRIYISGETGVAERTIIAIQDKVQWEHISEKYDIPKRDKRKFTEEQIHYLCKLIEDNPKMIAKELSEKTGVSTPTIYGVKRGEAWVDISQEYELPPNKKNKYSNKQIHKLCREIVKNPNHTNIELSRITGINRRTIGNIRKGKTRRDITEKYNIL